VNKTKKPDSFESGASSKQRSALPIPRGGCRNLLLEGVVHLNILHCLGRKIKIYFKLSVTSSLSEMHGLIKDAIQGIVN